MMHAMTGRHRLGAGWGLFFLLPLLLVGCEEDPGCLDVLANNYQVDAKDPCTDCCSYPELRLSFQHNWVSADSVRNFDTDGDVYLIGGIAYQFSRIRFYVSDIHLVREDGSILVLNETLELTFPEGGETVTQRIEDNFALVEAGSFQAKVPGRYRGEGVFIALEFTLGVSMPAGAATPEQFPDDHPLATQSPSMYTAESGYVHSLITFNPISGDSISQTWETFGADRLRDVSLPVTFDLDAGFHTELTLAIDYQQWFEGVNLSEVPDEAVLDQIVRNQANSFSLVGISSTLN